MKIEGPNVLTGCEVDLSVDVTKRPADHLFFHGSSLLPDDDDDDDDDDDVAEIVCLHAFLLLQFMFGLCPRCLLLWVTCR